LGKSEIAVQEALDEIQRGLPFRLLGVDSDNGSEFINWHLKRWCDAKQIQRTRGRPYKKDDNTHIEQKNWTHVRKLLGWDRYDSGAAVEAINAVYRQELRWWMKLYLPSVKLVERQLLHTWELRSVRNFRHRHIILGVYDSPRRNATRPI
jgi:transposase InsO family protein